MSDNPFSSPEHDEDPSVFPEEIACPVCGSTDFDRGSVRSSLSIYWHADADKKPKWYQLSKSGELLSSHTISSTADVYGLRCASCGVIILKPPADA